MHASRSKQKGIWTSSSSSSSSPNQRPHPPALNKPRPGASWAPRLHTHSTHLNTTPNILTLAHILKAALPPLLADIATGTIHGNTWTLMARAGGAAAAAGAAAVGGRLLGVVVRDEQLAVLAVAARLVARHADDVEDGGGFVEDGVHLLEGSVRGLGVEEVGYGDDGGVAVVGC